MIFLEFPYPPTWLSFIIVILAILIFSKQDLGMVLFFGTLTFSFLAQVPIIPTFSSTLTDISTHLLAVIMFLIPLLGGMMEKSEMMMEAIENMNISKKAALMITPALFGLLPVAGGALMSAPIVDQIEPSLPAAKKIAINVWFRHLLVFIYPLSQVILICTELAGLNQYRTVFFLIPPFMVMAIVGYFTLIRPLKLSEKEGQRNLKVVFRNLTPIIVAPVMDLIGRVLFEWNYPEIVTIVGLILSILSVMIMRHQSMPDLTHLFREMKIWRFPLLIYAIFYFLNVFNASGVPEQIGALQLPFLVLLVVGFLLGFATGRNQMPFSLLIPVYLFQNSLSIMPMVDFVSLYTAIFLGYLLTPLHPCLTYSIKYFKLNYRQTIVSMAIPTMLCFFVLILFYLVFLLFGG
ncbi:MAG: DUF401 family protein [Promethearchaeota archaeon]|nr:MAG: DUF401 family protein [Candidatus Lokiarchaeota archaeon]